VTLVVEGNLDETTCRRLVDLTGLDTGAVYGRRGKSYIDRKMSVWYANAERSPHDLWFVLRDLDRDALCAGAFMSERRWTQPRFGAIRLAVPSVEAWLLADRQGAAKVLQVSETLVPAAPERLADAKQAVLDLASQSRDRAVRNDLIPRPGAARKVGPGYDLRLGAFAMRDWSVTRACDAAPSLARAIAALARLRDRSASDTGGHAQQP
jgi:hypothetical protein